MKTVLQHEKYGVITYEEGFWTGKKNISINGVALNKVRKNVYQTSNGETVYLSGDYLRGAKMSIGEDTVALTPAIKWYEILLGVLPVVLVLIWGNSEALVSIFPVVGGAIGAFVSALFGVVNICVIKGLKSVPLKIIISIVFLALAFLACGLIGFLIILIAVA